MEILNTVGIDVSKSTIDVCIWKGQFTAQFANSNSGFIRLLNWVKKHVNQPLDQILFCCEHTGLYALALSAFMTEQELKFAMISGLEIKRSLGIQRGKNDQVDAKRISEFAFERKYKIKLYHLPSKTLLKLKHLYTLRLRLVRQRAGYQASLKEYKRVLKKYENLILFTAQESMIKQFTKTIKKVEKQMLVLIQEDEVLKNQYDLMLSIKGVGPVIATTMIVFTAGFSKFSNWRKFSCYIGTAPFQRQSGTSLKTRARVHYLGHRQIKGLLNLAANSAVLANGELKIYYQRRLAENKSKMSTLNIVRNKLLARIFAVIKRQSPYVDLQKFVA